MKSLKEIWVIMDGNEEKEIWNKIHNDFCFNPKYNEKTFIFNIPVDVYNIEFSPLYKDEKELNALMISIFTTCMGNDPYMLVLDWQHSCFYYNPRITKKKRNPTFIKDKRYGDGYNAYFPEFYPNGDFYFFIAKNFLWGYFTHPWKKRVWVFGEPLMMEIKNNALKLGFIKIEE
ncbi:MAG: DUF2716 domain-containing protein, partial [Spirochaetaceae bacterium]|nr:DUF2716 domain-containing protein [Spirochaetaceae bacterium]